MSWFMNIIMSAWPRARRGKLMDKAFDVDELCCFYDCGELQPISYFRFIENQTNIRKNIKVSLFASKFGPIDTDCMHTACPQFAIDTWFSSSSDIRSYCNWIKRDEYSDNVCGTLIIQILHGLWWKYEINNNHKLGDYLKFSQDLSINKYILWLKSS